MNAEICFTFLNTAILPAWFLLITFPRWRWTRTLVTSGFYSGLYALAYLLLIAFNFPGSEGSFSSLGGVQVLFSHPFLLLAGWVHYLAFDLLVGSWIVTDAQQHQIRHVVVIPSLVLTLLFGPLGWASYRVLRLINTR